MANDFNDFGFCRTGDGEFRSGVHPNCTWDFSVGNLGAGFQVNDVIHVIVRGDGRTDALLINGAQIVPEPGTYALLGAGLLGIFGVARRRKTA